MGLQIKGKTKAPGAQKLISQISSYLFEQEYDELRGKSEVKEKLKEATKALSTLL